ncbi:hypothetical protein KAW65_08590 [candidate division WOR-3 bacterium]|nr:hypothetical protein [candidate division WOR-3 bacterium]
MAKTLTLQAKLPKELYSEIKERVRLGLYSNESEAINAALKKAFAEEAREFLKGLIKNMKISKKEMLEEWKKVRQ